MNKKIKFSETLPYVDTIDKENIGEPISWLRNWETLTGSRHKDSNDGTANRVPLELYQNIFCIAKHIDGLDDINIDVGNRLFVIETKLGFIEDGDVLGKLESIIIDQEKINEELSEMRILVDENVVELYDLSNLLGSQREEYIAKGDAFSNIDFILTTIGNKKGYDHYGEEKEGEDSTGIFDTLDNVIRVVNDNNGLVSEFENDINLLKLSQRTIETSINNLTDVVGGYIEFNTGEEIKEYNHENAIMFLIDEIISIGSGNTDTSQKIVLLEDTTKNLVSDMEGVKGISSNNTESIVGLNDAVALMKTDIEEGKTEISDMGVVVESLTTEVVDVKTKVSDLSTRVETLETGNNELTNDVATLKNDSILKEKLTSELGDDDSKVASQLLISKVDKNIKSNYLKNYGKSYDTSGNILNINDLVAGDYGTYSSDIANVPYKGVLNVIRTEALGADGATRQESYHYSEPRVSIRVNVDGTTSSWTEWSEVYTDYNTGISKGFIRASGSLEIFTQDQVKNDIGDSETDSISQKLFTETIVGLQKIADADTKYATKIDLVKYITRDDSDERYQLKVAMDNYYSKGQTEETFASKTELGTYAVASNVYTKTESSEQFVSKTDYDAKVSDLEMRIKALEESLVGA